MVCMWFVCENFDVFPKTELTVYDSVQINLFWVILFWDDNASVFNHLKHI